MKQIFPNPAPLAFAALVAAATMAACHNDSTAPSTQASAIVATTPPPATAQVATTIPGPTVTATDAAGNPVAGATVTFDVTGGGAVQYPVATTNAQGIASAGLWQVGPKVGANTITASAPGATPVTFTLNSLPGPASSISAISGNGQTGAPGSTLADPLTARVTDAGGNPKPAVDVTFAVTAGGGSLSATQATTNASGDATSGQWTLGTGQCVQRVTATAGTLLATFTASSRSSIDVGGSASGALSTSDCSVNGAYVDEYDLTTPAGAFNISMTSAAAGAVLNVETADGTALVASNAGNPASLRLIAASGPKAVAATADPGATGAYSISVATTSSDVTDCTPVYLEIGGSTDQTLSTTDCKTNWTPPSGDWTKSDVSGDAFLVYIPAGTTVRISETAQPLDALIGFYSPAGTLITYRDNGGVGASGTEVINYTATTSGFYKVVAGSYCLLFQDPYQAGCDYGAYTLSVIKP